MNLARFRSKSIARSGALALPLLAGLAVACASRDHLTEPTLEIVAESERQWTGVAVAPDGRLFVNYPRWSDDVPVSVAEIVDGVPVPYPDERWNDWSPAGSPEDHFVCVQSVTVDSVGDLWILDPASPRFAGVVPGGAKLLRVDLDTDRVVAQYDFGPDVAPTSSYLNDVRVDVARQTAYLTDSGAGALIVLDLATGASRRVLAAHPSTQSEEIELTIEGQPFRMNGAAPDIHADGIALSPGREWIYYQALTGRTLYRISTDALRDATLTDQELAARVETVAQSGASDGIIFGPDGHLYLSSLEENAINRVTPDHRREFVVGDPRLAWPDSFATGPDGWIYVTTALIHRGADPVDPYRVWRFRP